MDFSTAFSTASKILVGGLLTVGTLLPLPSKAQYYGEVCTKSRTVPVWKEPVLGPYGWIPGRYEIETFVEEVPCQRRSRIYTPVPVAPVYPPACTSFGWKNTGGRYWFNLGC